MFNFNCNEHKSQFCASSKIDEVLTSFNSKLLKLLGSHDLLIFMVFSAGGIVKKD